jgi:hypothetical protein
MKVFLLLTSALSMAAADPPSLGIFLDFAQTPASSSLEEMKVEVASRLRQGQLDLRWRALNENRGTESFDQLVIVSFQGRCVPRPAGSSLEDSLPFRETVTLASTPVRDGHVLPYSRVDCDQIRKSLGDKVLALGRALGVVVAHELHHILHNSVKHAEAGWMRPQLDLKHLINTAGRWPDTGPSAGFSYLPAVKLEIPSESK